MNKKINVLLVISVLILGTVVGVMFAIVKEQRMCVSDTRRVLESRETIVIDQDNIIEGQKKVLENDLILIQKQFGGLQTDNDSLRNLASEQQGRIVKLLAIQADNTSKIAAYQRELETFRKVLNSYIIQIDSINKVNIALKEEKVDLLRKLIMAQSQYISTEEDNEILRSAIRQAQVLSISKITLTGLNDRDKRGGRVGEIAKLKVGFTIRENQSAISGEKTLHVTIIKPNGNVLVNRESGTFVAKDGSTVTYSSQRTIEYENKGIESYMFADNNERLVSGLYEVKLYCDGSMVGSSVFELK